MQVIPLTGPAVISATAPYAFKGASLVTTPAAAATVVVEDAAGRDLLTLGTTATVPSDGLILDSPIQVVGLTVTGAFTGTLQVFVE